MVGKILGFLLATSITVQTTSIAYVVVKYERITVYVSELFTKLKECENTPVPKQEPCKETPCDSARYFEQGKIEGLSLCPKIHERPFHKPSMTVTSNGHMVLDKKNNVYKIPILNSNPDSVNMLNDSLEEPINVTKGEIKVK